jgi:hypothetical protein
MDTKVGLLVGMEDTFPGPFLELVNDRGRALGIRAEMARLGGIPELQEPLRYQVVVDRISHEVPFYRAYLKSAALQGTVVVNDPFWWEADEKFFECTLARKLGVAVPRTVVLPNHSYMPFIDPQRSLRNLEYPLDWQRIIAHVGLPAVLKPNTGGGGRDVYMVGSVQELIEAYDQTETKTMILQERIEWEDYLRCLVIGREVLVFRFDPTRPLGESYLTDDPPSGALRQLATAQALTLTDALGYDMDTVEFAVRDGTLYAIDFLNPAPDFDSFSIKQEGFTWALDRMCQLVLDYATGSRQPPWHGEHRWRRFV